jgi:hypothetical protein
MDRVLSVAEMYRSPRMSLSRSLLGHMRKSDVFQDRALDLLIRFTSSRSERCIAMMALGVCLEGVEVTAGDVYDKALVLLEYVSHYRFRICQ